MRFYRVRFYRAGIVGGCLAASLVSGCYQPNAQVEPKAGSSGKSGTGGTAKPAGPLPPIEHGTDIADSRHSKALQMVTGGAVLEEAEKRNRLFANKGPAPSGTPTGSAPQPSPSASPSATPAAAFDPYIRPAMQRATPTATVDVRTSRSPVRPVKPGIPPPRTSVLAAPETAGGVLGITFDNLMFDMKPTDPFSPKLLSDAVRGLFDKKVKIRGYIHPASCPVDKGVTQFVLVRDDQGCCFGPGALIYDNIVVTMVPGKTTNFSIRPIAVEGVLTYREYKTLGDQPTSIFHLSAESVE